MKRILAICIRQLCNLFVIVSPVPPRARLRVKMKSCPGNQMYLGPDNVPWDSHPIPEDGLSGSCCSVHGEGGLLQRRAWHGRGKRVILGLLNGVVSRFSMRHISSNFLQIMATSTSDFLSRMQIRVEQSPRNRKITKEMAGKL